MKSVINIITKYVTSTNNKKIVEVFEEVLEISETINDALKAIQIKIMDNNDESISSEINSIIKKIKADYSKEELDRKLYIRILENIEVDTRLFDFEYLKFIMLNVGFNPQKNLYYLYESEKYFKSDNDLRRFVQNCLVTKNLSNEKIITSYESSINLSEYIKKINTSVINYIRDNNQFHKVEFNSNPFLDDKEIKFINQTMIVTFTDILPVTPESIENDEIVKDYKEHFENLDIFLDFLLAVRFGGDKKKSYVWLRAESDWGKSLLFQGILGELKLSTVITESELKKAYGGSASGFTADMFTHSWFLFVDEFKSAVSEIKNITHQITFSPKYQGQVTVPIYAKIFSSAENVSSLYNDGMVEEQYANRFIFWVEKGKITERDLYKNNQLLYKKVLKNYVYKYLKSHSENYIAIGEIEASNEANKKLDEIIELKRINTFSVEEVLREKIELFKNEYDNFNELCGHYFEDNNTVYIKNINKFKEVFINHYFSDSERKIINHKECKVILNLEDSKRETKRINGSPVSGYKWCTKKIIISINNSMIDFEGVAV